jgi:rubrerythrin
VDCSENFREFRTWLDEQIADEEKAYKMYSASLSKAAEVFGQNSREVRKLFSISRDENGHENVLRQMKALIDEL